MKKFSTKVVALTLAAGLLVGGTVGGTVAWLMDKTASVTNTFTVGDVEISLIENGNAIDTDTTINSFKIVPGTTQKKDPTVQVKANSEDSWIFVKIEESNNIYNLTQKYVNWTVDTSQGAWTEIVDLRESEGNLKTYVYYAEYTSGATLKEYPVLVNKEVSYSSGLTKENLSAANTTPPSLAFTAYAIQKDGLKTDAGDGMDALGAWNVLSSSINQ